MEGWIQQWQDHHSRLSEAVTTLQDALELRGIDLAAFYKDREANVLAGGEQGSSADDVPGYVRDAEAALDKRDEEEGFGRGEFRGSSGESVGVQSIGASSQIWDMNARFGHLRRMLTTCLPFPRYSFAFLLRRLQDGQECRKSRR